jgi:hypothetical protein
MSEVFQVITQTVAPKKGYPLGQVAYGYYTIAGDVVTMTDRHGNAADDGTGKRYTHKLAAGEDARSVAARMTKELRNALRKGAPANGFTGKISYPKMGIV